MAKRRVLVSEDYNVIVVVVCGDVFSAEVSSIMVLTLSPSEVELLILLTRHLVLSLVPLSFSPPSEVMISAMEVQLREDWVFSPLF